MSPGLSQWDFSIWYLKHVAFQPVSNCHEENSLQVPFKLQVSQFFTRHYKNKTLPSFTFMSVAIIWGRGGGNIVKTVPWLSELSSGMLLPPIYKEVLHFSCDVTLKPGPLAQGGSHLFTLAMSLLSKK